MTNSVIGAQTHLKWQVLVARTSGDEWELRCNCRGTACAHLGDGDLEQLYRESADEDRVLANMGMADYARLLANEDGTQA